MNYTELLNRFWRLDEERSFTTAETRMYLQLLDMFSRVGFDRSISMSNALAVGLFGISLNTYRTALQSLVERGLIAVEYRKEHRRRCAVFTLSTTKPTAANNTTSDTPTTVGSQHVATAPKPTINNTPNTPTTKAPTNNPPNKPIRPLPSRIRITARQRRQKPPRANHHRHYA